jgi:ribonuclease P protein component
LIVRRNSFGISRLGISISKKLGDAVSRNRVKRYIREVFRKTPSIDALSIDVVVVLKSPADSLDYHRIQREFRTLLSRWA